MGLSWQQGPLAPGAVGRFLVPDPLPDRMLFAEPLRRRMRVRFGESWIADSEDVVLLHEPGRYPVAYFPLDRHRRRRPAADRAHHPPPTSGRRPGTPSAPASTASRARPGSTPSCPTRSDLKGAGGVRVAGHGRLLRRRRADRRPCRRQLPPHRHPADQPPPDRPPADRVVADTTRPLVLYESGFAPRWYVPRADVDESALTAVDGQTFCPYKGLASYYDIGGRTSRGVVVRGRLDRGPPHLRPGVVRAGHSVGAARWHAAPSRTGSSGDAARHRSRAHLPDALARNAPAG